VSPVQVRPSAQWQSRQNFHDRARTGHAPGARNLLEGPDRVPQGTFLDYNGPINCFTPPCPMP
jgi:hypothetical protein